MKKIKKPLLIAVFLLAAVLSGWKAIDYFFLDKYAYYIFPDTLGVEERIAEKQAALDALGVRWETKPMPEGRDDLTFKTGIYILRKDKKTVREWEETVWAQRSDSSSSEYDEDFVYVWQ